MFVRPLHILVVLACFLTSLRSYPLEGSYDFYDAELEHEAGLANVDFPHGEEYLDVAGDDFGDSVYSDKGYLGNEGYKKFDEFNKGYSGNYGSQGDKGHYNDRGGHSAGHDLKSNRYDVKHQQYGANKGGDYAESNSYNKGSKTAGFHNVYHKEEYKKDKSFYDEKNSKGHYNKYGDFGATLLAAAGAEERQKVYDQGYRNSNYGKQGFSDRGSLYDNSKKYGSASGNDKYYNNLKDYNTNGGSSSGHYY